MANINNELNKIRNAIYGEDMRLAIYNGIKKINDDANTFSSETRTEIEEMNSTLQTASLSLLSKIDDAYVEDGYLYMTSGGEVVVGPLGPFSGGGGGGGSSTNDAKLTLTNTSGWMSKSIAQSESCIVSFNWSSIENETPTGRGSVRIQISGVTKAVMEVDQGDVEIDVSKYLSAGQNIIAIAVTDIYGNSRTIRLTVSVISLVLSSSFDASTVYSGAISFPYTPTGSGSKTVYFILDGVEIGTVTTTVTGRQLNYTIEEQSHGSHTLSVYFETEINGENVRSNELYYEIMWVSASSVTPIITSTYQQTTVNQFDTINIDYTVYSPNSINTDISIMVNDSVVSAVAVDRSPHVFTYRADNAGQLSIMIFTGDEGEYNYASKSWTITVNAVDIDVEAENENLALYLNARGRSNGESTREEWKYGNISASLTGFNWRINGWLQDSDGIDVLRLCDDARVTIPYQIFGNDFKQGGKTIEIEFATREVADYGSVILSCVNEDSSGNYVGLKFTPQNVYFSGHQTSISTPYKENEHIRISIVVEKQNENRLIMIYINGIASRAIQYASGERFSQLSPVGITIGSNDCGIDIYNIRVYDQDLSSRQIVNNWIADTQVGSLLKERYDRNNIYSESGDITTSTILKNIGYFVINSDELPQYKGDEKTVTGSYINPEDESKSFTFDGCVINVQGTSSSVYYVKNIDMKFKNGFNMTKSETHADSYALRDGSIPFNRFVLKADVASSESTNNTGLTMFYNDSCPYKTPEMVENSKVRWGIEGIPCLMFHHNTQTGDVIFMGKYNFNLPKRAPGPLGFSGNMESWEWERNNSENVKFLAADFTTQAWDELKQEYYPEWYDDFEARFPSDEWRNTAKLGEFLRWVLSTARSKATGNTLSSPVTYDLTTITTLNNYSSDNSYTVTEIIEDGVRTGYSITFTKDTEAYRLTKFRAEASQYMEIDSAIFYYLFTEFFTMIDSRAKNMFVGFNGSDVTQSGRAMDRKATFQPYDMDTAIGTNNSGVLMFGYSLEDTDTVSSVISGEGGSDGPVYNAQDSALWCNIRDAFRAEISVMYQNLRNDNNKLWTYNTVVNRFAEHQSKWSETIYNEDARVKYLIPLINPVTVDEDTGELIKTDRYLTMLQGSKAEQRKWWLYNRFRYMDSKYNTGDATRTISMRLFNSGTLTITPAIDLYVGVRFGGGTTLQLQRTQSEVPVEFQYTTSSSVTEMETWIYSADLIADVGDLSVFYPNELDFSRATRLRRLKIGSSTNGYSNTNLTTIDVRNSALLEYIDCRNCPNLAISVNLEGSPRIKEAYFDGTSITGVELADGATIETLHLPGSIKALTLMNLTKLTDLTITSVANVGRLMIANMDEEVIDPVTTLRAIEAGSQVYIEGIDLELANAAAIEEFLGLLDTMRGVTRELGANGEWLYHDYDTAQVSGIIHTESLTGDQIESYNARYPYLTIDARHTTTTLTYYNWEGTEVLHTETIVDGGNGTYTGTPSHDPDDHYTYTFAGWALHTMATSANPNAVNGVTKNRSVYAAYTLVGQTYTVKFYNGNTLLETVNDVAYGATAIYSGETPTYTSDPENFEFTGWDPSPSNITGNTDCYAQYRDLRSKLVQYLEGAITEYESDTITTIGQYAFYNRANLTSVKLNSTDPVTISAYAFSGCNSITEFFIRSATVSILSNTNGLPGAAFITGRGVIYVPDNLVNSYKTATNWITFKGHIYSIDDYPVTDFSTISDSWSDILANETNGTYSTKYSVGDTKRITIDNSDYYAQIVAFDADELSYESGNAKITWILKELYGTHKMNSSPNTNANGWPESAMRSYLSTDILPLIPDPIKSAIKEVKKTSYDKTTSADVTSNDKLWIPSAREVLTSSSYGYEASGPSYTSVFSNNANRVKYDGALTSSWWLRSASSNSTTSFQRVKTNGDWDNVSAGAGGGVCLGFCT